MSAKKRARVFYVVIPRARFHVVYAFKSRRAATAGSYQGEEIIRVVEAPAPARKKKTAKKGRR